jgi:hypothetical protein
LGLLRQAGKEGVSMPERSERAAADGEQRRVTLLEAVAAAVIFTMVLLVLFMIFVYKPA